MRVAQYAFASFVTVSYGAASAELWKNYARTRPGLTVRGRNAAMVGAAFMVAGTWFCAIK